MNKTDTVLSFRSLECSGLALCICGIEEALSPSRGLGRRRDREDCLEHSEGPLSHSLTLTPSHTYLKKMTLNGLYPSQGDGPFVSSGQILSLPSLVRSETKEAGCPTYLPVAFLGFLDLCSCSSSSCLYCEHLLSWIRLSPCPAQLCVQHRDGVYTGLLI